MFTGIVQGLKPVLAIRHDGGVARLDIGMEALVDGLEMGASVAVNGVCLTAVERVGNDAIGFDVIGETLALTNLGELKAGSLVNVERSMLATDEIGGHRVSGHVFGAVEVAAIERVERNCVATFRAPPSLLKYLFHKGFVALNGASLTISAIDREAGTFAVSLIPETLTRTTFGAMQVGDRINAEADSQTQAVVDTVAAMMQDPAMLSMVQSATQSAD